MAREIARAWRKWPTGIFIGWYPIKDLTDVEPVLAQLHDIGAGRGLRLEVMIDHLDDGPKPLSGCGLLVINPPWTLKEEAQIILPALAQRLARGGDGAYRCQDFGGS